MSPKLSLRRRAFTLVELLVVIAIIGILVGMILPAVQAAREAARRATCLNNVKQLALACISYESANSKFPPCVGSNEESFLVRILPQLEQKPLFDEFRAGGGANIEATIQTLAETELDVFRCASTSTSDFRTNSGGAFTAHYAGCSGPANDGDSATGASFSSFSTGLGELGLSGLFSPTIVGGAIQRRTANGVDTTDVNDGLSNTMAIIETSRSNFTSNTTGGNSFTNSRFRWSSGGDVALQRVSWARSVVHTINSFDAMTGTANPIHSICISSEHSGGANIANGDGSVKFVSEDQDLFVLQAAAGVDDGQTVNLDQ